MNINEACYNLADIIDWCEENGFDMHTDDLKCLLESIEHQIDWEAEKQV